MSYSILPPFIIPRHQLSLKKVNISDEFIFKTIKQLFLPYNCSFSFSTRQPLKSDDINNINSSNLLFLGGANQLRDNYQIIPCDITKIKVSILPIGMGITGHAKQHQKMSTETIKIIGTIHELIKFSLW